jgi:hypothetical protein
MIRKMDRRAITFGLTLALFLAWSGVAHSQGLYTVHQTTVRVKVAFEDCEGEGECRIRYQLLNPARFTRLLCEISDDERIPQGFTLATFISCDGNPDAMISVWDKRNEEHVCGSLDLSVFAGAFEDGAGDRGKAELLFSSEEGPPLFATALARYAPLPRRLEIDEICWNTYRTHSVAGALDPGTVIMEGRLRAGAPIAVYGDFER